MTARNAIVLINGRLQELPVGDTLNGATGGGGSSETGVSGSAVLDFGDGSMIAVATVVDQTTIGANSQVDAWIMGSESADHNTYEHMIVPITVRAGNVVPGVGFDIVGTSPVALTGQFAVQWARSL